MSQWIARSKTLRLSKSLVVRGSRARTLNHISIWSDHAALLGSQWASSLSDAPLTRVSPVAIATAFSGLDACLFYDLCDPGDIRFTHEVSFGELPGVSTPGRKLRRLGRD